MGLKTQPNTYIGKSSNAGLMDTNTLNPEVKTDIRATSDKVSITDTDQNPNLDVGLYQSRRDGSFYLRVSNSDGGSPTGPEHTSGVQFSLGQLPEKTIDGLRNLDTNGGLNDIRQVEVSQHGNGLLVELDPGRFPGHNGYIIGDAGSVKVRSGPPSMSWGS